MKKIFQISALALLPASTSIYAHTSATDTVDDEIYTITDSFLADTPSTVPDLDETDDSTTRTSITTDSLSMFETLAARGDLLEYIELLGGGDVTTSISLNDDGSVTMTVNQLR